MSTQVRVATQRCNDFSKKDMAAAIKRREIPITDLSDLPIRILCDNIFPFLTVNELIKTTLQCNRELRRIGKLDIVWVERWKHAQAKKQQQLQRKKNKQTGKAVDRTGAFAPLEAAKNNLYLHVCNRQRQLVALRGAKMAKKRLELVRSKGPVHALRTNVLEYLAIQGHAVKRSVSNDDLYTVCAHLINCRDVYGKNESSRFEEGALLDSIGKPRQTASRKEAQWVPHNLLTNPVNTNNGGIVFTGCILFKLNIDERCIKYDREFFSSDNALVIRLEKRGGVFKNICSAGLSVTKKSVKLIAEIENFELLQFYLKSSNHYGKTEYQGSLVFALWKGDLLPTCAFSSIPLAMLAKNLPGYSNDAENSCDLTECSAQVTIRTFSRVLWENLFTEVGAPRKLDGSRLSGEQLSFRLLENAGRSASSHIPSNGLNDLNVSTASGITYTFEDCFLIDATLFTAVGHPVWARSELVKFDLSSSRFDISLTYSNTYLNRKVAKVGEDNFITISIELLDGCEDEEMSGIISVNSVTLSLGAEASNAFKDKGTA